MSRNRKLILIKCKILYVVQRIEAVFTEKSAQFQTTYGAVSYSIWVELHVIELSKQKSLRLTNQILYIEPRMEKLFQILFVRVRKSTTSFTHKGTKTYLKPQWVMRCRVNHSEASTKAKQYPNSQTTDSMITEWKLTEVAALQSSWSHPRKIIERLCLPDINFV